MSGRARGFTLIEVLVALFVLAVGLLGLASMQMNANKANANSGKTTRAVMIAQDRIEMLRTAPFAELTTAGSNALDACERNVQILNTSGVPIDYFQVTCTVEDTAGGCTPELLCLQVSVAYPESANPVTQITLRSDQGGAS